MTFSSNCFFSFTSTKIGAVKSFSSTKTFSRSCFLRFFNSIHNSIDRGKSFSSVFARFFISLFIGENRAKNFSQNFFSLKRKMEPFFFFIRKNSFCFCINSAIFRVSVFCSFILSAVEIFHLRLFFVLGHFFSFFFLAFTIDYETLSTTNLIKYTLR